MKPFSLSISEPCHENWDAMVPDDKGRFCASCQKAVIDFSAMSDREVAQFFKKPVGAVCGRFDGSQLNRVVEVPRRRLPWIKYFFGIALPAFLFAKKAAAQGEVRQTMGRPDYCPKTMTTTTKTLKLKDSENDTLQPEMLRMGFVSSKMKAITAKTITGQVKNANGEAIPHVSVRVKEEGRVVVADSTGAFSVTYFTLPLTLEVSSVGYQEQTVVYSGEKDFHILLKKADYERVTMGLVAVVEKTIQKKKVVTETPTPRKVEAASIKFSVYPNPVSVNSSFTIDAKGLESGNYLLQLLNSSGGLVQAKELTLTAKVKSTMETGGIAAGSYFVKLVNRKNGKSGTEILLVH